MLDLGRRVRLSSLERATRGRWLEDILRCSQANGHIVTLPARQAPNPVLTVDLDRPRESETNASTSRFQRPSVLAL